MNILWCRNNLTTVGKWGGTGFLFGLAITAFMFGQNLTAHAYVIETVATSSYPPTQLRLDFNPTGKLNEITAPLNDFINSALKSFELPSGVNMGTRTGTPLGPIKMLSQTIDFNKFFSSSKVSSNDVTSFLKEAAITGINLTILIISITSQVLKGILSVLKP